MTTMMTTMTLNFLFGEAPIPSRKLGEGQVDDNDDGLPPFEN
jgi:hypothetical protein